MSENDNLQTVQRIYKAIAAGDLPTVLKAMADNVELFIPGSENLPPAGLWRGKEGVEQFFKKVNEVLEFEALEPDEFIVGRDSIVVLGHERCRMRKTARLAEINWAHVWTFSGG